MEKLKDGKTGRVFYTSVACRLLDTWTCRCTCYADRSKNALDCIVMAPGILEKIEWLPATCAYRLLAQGEDLAWWHPLVSGDPESVHRAGISVRDKAISEVYVHPEDVDCYAIGYRI